jgi:hypothetical protein
VAEFVFHAGPDSAQIYCVHSVEEFGWLIGGIGWRGLDTGVVERQIQATEGRERALERGGDLVLVGHIAGETERLMPAEVRSAVAVRSDSWLMSTSTTAAPASAKAWAVA